MRISLIWLFIILLRPAFGQSLISLDQCYQWARENYPNLKQSELWQETARQNKENIKTSLLPQLMVHGQATYQSDVPDIGISIPNMILPSVPKDQYKVYAEFRQAIWDGGISEAAARLEDALLQNNLNQLEVAFYALNEQVSQAYFTILAMNQQKEVLAAQRLILQEKLQAVQSGIENQMIERPAALVLKAEILLLHQNETELDAGKNSALQMLTILTGKTFGPNSHMASPERPDSDGNPGIRPEIELFAKQTSRLELQLDLLDKNRNPKIFGFGQAGYGKPGLNMLSDASDSFYLAGIGFSWNPFDWKNSTRQKQVIRLQQEMISRQKETFNQHNELLLAKQIEQIRKLKRLLETDAQLITLRTEIASAYASKFDNGVITAADYIREVQNETITRLQAELHQIQLMEAIEKYHLIEGKGVR